MVGRLERLELREVWKHEAHDFSSWLSENIELLEEELGLSLTLVGLEQAAGDFSVDVLAKNDSGQNVIIENQLEWSNHMHLGQVITYLAAYDASVAIWIARGARPEHVEAISWLNQNSTAAFYLLKLEAVRIDDSPPAPLLTLIIGPNEETRAVRERKQDIQAEEEILNEFWTQLKSCAESRQLTLHSDSQPYKAYYLRAMTGIDGVYYYYQASLDSALVSLYMQSEDIELNEKVFQELAKSRNEIDGSLEDLGTLRWQRRENWAIRKIELPVASRGYRDHEQWPQVQADLVDAMIRFEAAFRPHLERIKKDPSIEQTTGPTEQSLG